MMFSVVVPTLNESIDLPLLLGDLHSQTNQDFEVIVADGGSSDKTQLVAQKYQKMYKKFTFLTTNIKNVSRQRNIGARKAQGDYIIFFDADVRIPIDYIEKIRDQIETKKYQILTTNITSKNKLLREYLVTILANLGRELLIWFGYPFVGGYNIVIKRSLFWEVQGFNEALFYAEDVDLVQRIAKKGQMIKNLRHPYLYFSFRRFNKYGYTKVLFDYLRHLWLTEKIIEAKKPVATYPMGGDVYK